MIRLAVVIAARNEELTISRVLEALDSQSLRPSLVVVVDDGSTDATPDILKENVSRYHFEVRIVKLSYHEESYVGSPKLGRVFESGVAVIREFSPLPDYVMKLDAEHVLPVDYLEKVVTRMERDLTLAVASGWIEGEKYMSHTPRGSSMVIKTEIWVRANGMRFYATYSWEQWLIFKARQMGYKTLCFKDIQTRIARKTSNPGVSGGRMMYELGYDWRYALARCAVLSLRSPAGAVKMLSGYLRPGNISRVEISSWIGPMQRKAMPKLMWQYLRSIGHSEMWQ